MVAVGAGVALPQRQFSAFILGDVWPTTATDSWTAAAKLERAFADASTEGAGRIRSSASTILSNNSGRTITSMSAVYDNDSNEVKTQANLFDVMANAIDRSVGVWTELGRNWTASIDRRYKVGVKW